jgi:hypothetical protein
LQLGLLDQKDKFPGGISETGSGRVGEVVYNSLSMTDHSSHNPVAVPSSADSSTTNPFHSHDSDSPDDEETNNSSNNNLLGLHGIQSDALHLELPSRSVPRVLSHDLHHHSGSLHRTNSFKSDKRKSLVAAPSTPDRVLKQHE